MKINSIIFSIGLLSTIYICKAQPVINPVTKISSPYTVMVFDTNGISAGPSGKNMVWDFSKQATLNKTSINKYLPADSCPGYKNFPKADIALPTGGDRYIFYDTSGGWSKVGLYYNDTKPATIITYIDFQKLGKGPFKYNYFFSDDFLGKYSGPKGTAERIGKYSKAVDGYGTLITPAGTFKNTLRVKVTENIKDEFAGAAMTTSTDVVMYQWITEGTSYPIMTIYESRVRNITDPEYIYKNATYSSAQK